MSMKKTLLSLGICTAVLTTAAGSCLPIKPAGPAKLGERVSNEAATITVQSLEERHARGYCKIKDGYTYLIVGLTVQNTGRDAIDTGALAGPSGMRHLWFAIRNASGEQYNEDTGYRTASTLFRGILAPGEECRGCLVFQVPARWDNLTFNAVLGEAAVLKETIAKVAITRTDLK